jgi:hypothetical protein
MALAESALPLPLQKASYCVYRQVYFDGTVIILMNDYVRGMDELDPRCQEYFVAMREIANEGAENLDAMHAMAEGR